MSDEQHPIAAHVEDYIKTLTWSPSATEDVKTFVIGNLRGFAAHLASIDNADILDDPRVDKELHRWQEAIRDKLIEMGAPDWKVDGGSCDSGDPLDFTLAEVGQGVGYFIDQLEELRTASLQPPSPQSQSWVVHIVGPDDVIPKSGELDALRSANEVNAAIERDRRRHANDPNYPFSIAIAKQQ